MKRWDFIAGGEYYIEEAPDGDWVRWEDVEFALRDSSEARGWLGRKLTAARDCIKAAQLAAERYKGAQCEECAGLVDDVLGALTPAPESPVDES